MSDETARPGSAADLSRRIERLEHKYDEVALVVARVEANQQHAEELNKLRFDGLTQAITTNSAKLDAFIARVEGMVDGTIQTAQARQGAEMVADYQKWRREVDTDRARVSTLGRLGVLLVTSNLLAWGAAIYALLHP